jgi:hypothetical protein
MAQYTYPISDISVHEWYVEPLYNYIKSTAITCNHAGGNAILGLGNVSDPGVHSGHIVYVRARYSNAFKYELLQGTTVIHSSGNLALTHDYVIYSFTLTEAEVANITDYADLRIRITNVTPDGTCSISKNSLYLEIPDVVPSVQKLKVRVSGVWNPLVSVKVKVSGVWVPVKVSARVNGEWKTVHEN